MEHCTPHTAYATYIQPSGRQKRNCLLKSQKALAYHYICLLLPNAYQMGHFIIYSLMPVLLQQQAELSYRVYIERQNAYRQMPAAKSAHDIYHASNLMPLSVMPSHARYDRWGQIGFWGLFLAPVKVCTAVLSLLAEWLVSGCWLLTHHSRIILRALWLRLLLLYRNFTMCCSNKMRRTRKMDIGDIVYFTIILSSSAFDYFYFDDYYHYVPP